MNADAVVGCLIGLFVAGAILFGALAISSLASALNRRMK